MQVYNIKPVIDQVFALAEYERAYRAGELDRTSEATGCYYEQPM